jgi:drug/metabolite transporter (DMT)-like permease
LFYYFALAALCTAPFVPLVWKTPTKDEWIALTLIGVLQAASQFLIINAYRYAKPGQIAPFNYSVVVFSGLLGWIIWGTKPDAMSIAGVVLVCAGGVFTTLKASPNSHGHFGWIGHWNALHLHRKQREKEIVQAARSAA